MQTLKQYETVVQQCESVFLKKHKDYGTSWRVLRTIAIVDQIFIKAKRIRQIQENSGHRKIEDSIESEFSAIVNYGYIALIQLTLSENDPLEIGTPEVDNLYRQQAAIVKKLMIDKNHDYGEAWRDMSQESFTDLILTKLLRIKQIISNEGKTLVSEGIDANFRDIINYAIFALILIQEKKETL